MELHHSITYSCLIASHAKFAAVVDLFDGTTESITFLGEMFLICLFRDFRFAYFVCVC